MPKPPSRVRNLAQWAELVAVTLDIDAAPGHTDHVLDITTTRAGEAPPPRTRKMMILAATLLLTLTRRRSIDPDTRKNIRPGIEGNELIHPYTLFSCFKYSMQSLYNALNLSQVERFTILRHILL